MEKDLRYDMKHLGDLLMDKIVECGSALKASTRGISLTVNIDKQKDEKDRIIKLIGKRTVALRNSKAGEEFVADDVLSRLFFRLDKIQDEIDRSIAERKARLHPKKS